MEQSQSARCALPAASWYTLYAVLCNSGDALPIHSYGAQRNRLMRSLWRQKSLRAARQYVRCGEAITRSAFPSHSLCLIDVECSTMYRKTELADTDGAIVTDLGDIVRISKCNSSAEIRLQDIDSQFNFNLPSNTRNFHICETIHGIFIRGSSRYYTIKENSHAPLSLPRTHRLLLRYHND